MAKVVELGAPADGRGMQSRRLVLVLLFALGACLGSEVVDLSAGGQPAGMGNLPNARNTTYGAASPVKSVDLDDLQDMIIAGKHGLIKRKLPVSMGSYSNSNGWSPGTWVPFAVNDFFSMPLPVIGGEQIVEVVAKVKGLAAETMKLQVYRYNVAGLAAVQLGADANSVGTGARETIQVAGLTENINDADEYNYYALLKATNGTPWLLGVELWVQGQ